jgi:hypothetical protein
VLTYTVRAAQGLKAELATAVNNPQNVVAPTLPQKELEQLAAIKVITKRLSLADVDTIAVHPQGQIELARKTARECATMIRVNHTELRPVEMFRSVNVTVRHRPSARRHAITCAQVTDYEPLKKAASVTICRPTPVCKKVCTHWGLAKKCWNECFNGEETCRYASAAQTAPVHLRVCG